jgi:hypothetical protein
MDSALTTTAKLITELAPLLIAVLQVGRIGEEVIAEVRRHRGAIEGFRVTFHELLQEMKEVKSILKNTGDSL